jgi:hypothetical protein
MAALNMSVPHKLSREEALSRIKGLFTKLKSEHKDMISEVKESWQDNVCQFQFDAKGFNISGTITVTDNSVDISADVPFMVSLFKGKIQEVVSKEAGKLLAPAK